MRGKVQARKRILILGNEVNRVTVGFTVNAPVLALDQIQRHFPLPAAHPNVRLLLPRTVNQLQQHRDKSPPHWCSP